MSAELVLCDTSVVSDLRLGGVGTRAVTVLATATKAISVVTVAEVRAGARLADWGERKTASLNQLLRAYVTFTIDEETADCWARLWAICRDRGSNVGHNDLWIAATASRLDVPVVALDHDFARIPGIRLIDESGEERVTE